MKKLNKYILLMIISQIIVIKAEAQVLMSIIFGDKLNSDKLSFGLHIDHSWNQLSNIDHGSSLGTLNLGTFFTLHLTEHWNINLEILMKYTRGADKLPIYDLNDEDLNEQFNGGELSREIKYVSLPLTVQYLLADFLLEVGPQFSLKTRATDVFEVEGAEGRLKLDKDINERVKRFDLGWLTGVGYRLGKEKRITVGLRYQASFSDVINNVYGRQENRQFGLFANIPLGAQKSKKE